MKAKRRKRSGLSVRKSKLAGTSSGTAKIPDQPDPPSPSTIREQPDPALPQGNWVMLKLSIGLYLIWLLYLASVAVWG